MKGIFRYKTKWESFVVFDEDLNADNGKKMKRQLFWVLMFVLSTCLPSLANTPPGFEYKFHAGKKAIFSSVLLTRIFPISGEDQPSPQATFSEGHSETIFLNEIKKNHKIEIVSFNDRTNGNDIISRFGCSAMKFEIDRYGKIYSHEPSGYGSFAYDSTILFHPGFDYLSIIFPNEEKLASGSWAFPINDLFPYENGTISFRIEKPTTVHEFEFEVFPISFSFHTTRSNGETLIEFKGISYFSKQLGLVVKRMYQGTMRFSIPVSNDPKRIGSSTKFMTTVNYIGLLENSRDFYELQRKE